MLNPPPFPPEILCTLFKIVVATPLLWGKSKRVVHSNYNVVVAVVRFHFLLLVYK